MSRVWKTDETSRHGRDNSTIGNMSRRRGVFLVDQLLPIEWKRDGMALALKQEPTGSKNIPNLWRV